MAWAALAPELILTAASLILLVVVTATHRPGPAGPAAPPTPAPAPAGPAVRPALPPGSAGHPVRASEAPAAVGARAHVLWGGVTAAAFAVALLALIPGIGPRGQYWPAMLSLDHFAALFRGIFLAAGLLVALISIDFVGQRAPGRGEYWPLLLWGVLGMMLMASSRDLLMIYLGLELVSLCSYVLAGYLKEDARSVEAAIKYFLTGAVASAVILFGITLLYGASGTTSLDPWVLVGASPPAGGQMAPLAHAAVVFLVIGFGFKVAAAPLHMWAPDAYEGAPTPITAFFSVGPKAAAFAVLLRLFYLGLGRWRAEWTLAFAVLAVLSMFVGNLSALPQKNIKRMMAYSAIAHAGYVLVGLAVGTPMGSRAVAYYLLAYLFANLGVFAVIVAVSARAVSARPASGRAVSARAVALSADLAQGEQIEDYTGLARRQPLLAWAMVIYFLSLIGIPPTAGFFGKFYLFSAALEQSQVWLALVIVVNSVISVGYYYGVVRQMFLVGEAPDAATEGTGHAQPHRPEPASAGSAAAAPPPAVPGTGVPVAGGRPTAGDRVCPAVVAVVVVTAILTLVVGLGFEYFLGWASAATAILP